MSAFDLTPLLTLDGLIALFVLILLEIVLGIDNIIFIAIITGQLIKQQQQSARAIGLSLALIIRVILLFGASYIMHMKEPLFYIDSFGASGRDLILFGGGLFLIVKTIIEIIHKFKAAGNPNYKERKLSMTQAIVQIALIDIVFSFDSILTAVAVSDHLSIMVIAVVVSMIVMLLFARYVSEFINKYPTIKMLALCFLILIGLLMLIEALHVHIDGVDLKSYAYVAMGFSLIVELLNIRLRIVILKKNF